MARRVTSSALVGRTDELASVRAAADAAAAGQARIVLISGDAGIGKTRLVSAACDELRQAGMLVAVGGCIQLGDVSVAYAPLIEAMRELRRQLDPEVVADIFGVGVDDIVADIAAFLGGGVASRGSGPLFEHVLDMLAMLSATRSLVLVFEDMHWADASTRDLIAYLGRNLRDIAVTLVLTYRADELHRRHPLRSLLTDLERDPKVERIALIGLRRADLVVLLNEIGEATADADVVDEVLRRTDGNPFYVEELAAAGQLTASLPASLADVILARVSSLSEATIRVLQQAAVLGQDVDDVLLAELSEQPLAAVSDALREAVTQQLLVLNDSGCRFRHALIREALYDDLLPGERTALHLAAARIVASATHIEEHTRWALIAHHADAGRDLGTAFAASVRAGVESERVHALSAAAGQYERALDLWNSVPDPVAASGMTHAELLLRAAESLLFTSRSPRSLSLAEGALAALERAGATAEQRAVVMERIGRVNWTLGRGAATVAAYEQAVELLADRPASHAKALSLAALGQSLMLRDRHLEAEPILRQAIDIAEQAGASGVEGHALCSLGPVLANLGRADEAMAAMERSLELLRAYGTSEDVGRAYTNLVHVLYSTGRYDAAVSLGVEASDYALETGHNRHFGAAIAANRIMALILCGRWSEVDPIKRELDDRINDNDPYVDVRWINLLIGQGRRAEARIVAARTLEATVDRDDVQFRAVALMRAADVAVAEQRWDDARGLFVEGIAIATAADEQYYSIRGYAHAIRAEADRIEAAVGRQSDSEVAQATASADRLFAGCRAYAQRLAELGVSLLAEPFAWLATAELEHARVQRTDDAAMWRALGATWDGVGQPYPAAMARYRQADALLRSRGDRDQASEVARAVLAIADSLGAVPLAEDVKRLAERGRLDLNRRPEPAATGPGLNITPRETEVLAQLAAGRTNRQIAQALFISEKTASVHVTNLLRKLGVTSRVEAAAIGQRLGSGPEL